MARFRSNGLLAALLLTLCACGGGAPGSAVENVAGKYVHHVVVGGIEREFIVFVPGSVAGNTHVPVVFMIHGTAQDGEELFMFSGWAQEAAAEGFIAVFPSALTYCFYEDDDNSGTFDANEQQVVTKWAGGGLGDPSRRPLCTPAELATVPAGPQALADHPLADDVAFYEFMFDFLSSHYSIDEKRIYVSGFSNGAEMSSRLAVELSTRIAAAAVNSSSMSIDPTPAARPLSLILTVGAIDPAISAKIGEYPIPLTESLITTSAPFRIGFIAPFLTALSLSDTYTWSQQTIAGELTSQFLFETSTVGASNSFRAVIVEDLEHEYPNGGDHPIVMAKVLWEFFKTQSLP